MLPMYGLYFTQVVLIPSIIKVCGMWSRLLEPCVNILWYHVIHVWIKEIFLLLYLLQLLHHFFNAQVSSVAHLVLHLGQPITELFVFVIEDGPRVEAICDFLLAQGHLGRGRKKWEKWLLAKHRHSACYLLFVIHYVFVIIVFAIIWHKADRCIDLEEIACC